MKNNITAIIPVLSIKTKEEKKLLHKAILSFSKQTQKVDDLMIVLPTAQEEEFNKEFGDTHVTLVLNDGDTSFGGQVNYGASQVKTTHMLVMGMDDELAPFYIELVSKYVQEETDNNVFLPIVLNIEAKKVVGLSNELAWAQSFYNEEGIVDLDSAKVSESFGIYGMVMEVKQFIEVGGIKPSIKVSFAQEALMRFADNGLRIRVVPKLGYQRLIGRKGSLTKSYESMTFDEVKFWLELSKEEYKFITDREIVYDDKTTK